MAVLEVLLPVRRGRNGSDPMLVGTYAYMGVMETLGFAAFFRDRLVAGVGGLGMLPIVIAALRPHRWWQRR